MKTSNALFGVMKPNVAYYFVQIASKTDGHLKKRG